MVKTETTPLLRPLSDESTCAPTNIERGPGGIVTTTDNALAADIYARFTPFEKRRILSIASFSACLTCASTLAFWFKRVDE
jgi:hypothetical protein